MMRLPFASYVWEFILFGIKEARACVFAGSFFALLFLSNHIPLFGGVAFSKWRESGV